MCGKCRQSPYLAVPPAMSSTDSASGHCGRSRPASTHSTSVSAGVKAFRIWMKATLSVRYAALPKNMVAAVDAMMGASRVTHVCAGGMGRSVVNPACTRREQHCKDTEHKGRELRGWRWRLVVGDV